MQTSSSIAFKEWAVVVDALGRGDQVLILRKGGIIEDNGKFTVDHRRFWLFPTLFHQQMASVVPGAQRDFEPVKAHHQPEGSVAIEFFVTAERVIECTDLAKVRSLSGQHIWKESVIEDRFHYGKTDGIHAILARVYRLPRSIIPMLSGYGGCKSWVELERPLPTAALKPVLSDAAFEARSAIVLATL